jgi:hypothetical protein
MTEDIEMEIDRCRFAQDWISVQRGCDLFCNIVDENIQNKSMQTKSNENKAFYYTCLAESTFEFQLDFGLAFDFLAKTIEIDPLYIEARIIASRILLEAGNDLIKCYTSGLKPRKSTRTFINVTLFDENVVLLNAIEVTYFYNQNYFIKINTYLLKYRIFLDKIRTFL